MHIGYMQWHEGIGYDLKALARSTAEEQRLAEDLLLSRACQDWRDVEALDQLGTERAVSAMRTGLRSKDFAVKIEAATRLELRGLFTPTQIEWLLLETLSKASLQNGMTRVLAYAAAHPTEPVRRELLWCAVRGNDDIRVHAAALAHHLYGKSSSSFDPEFRALYLHFGSKRAAERKAAYRELCRSIGIDPDAPIRP